MIQSQKRGKENFMEEWPQKMSRSSPNRKKDMNSLEEKLLQDPEKQQKMGRHGDEPGAEQSLEAVSGQGVEFTPPDYQGFMLCA